MGDIISYGFPLVRQERNLHDDREDYEIEDLANRATDLLIDILRSANLKSNNCFDSLCELVEHGINYINNLDIKNLIVENIMIKIKKRASAPF